MNAELLDVMRQIERARKVDQGVLIQAIEAALVSASRKHYGAAQEIRVAFNNETGDLTAYVKKAVVETVSEEWREVGLGEARRQKRTVKLGELLEVPMSPMDFGRIAAQTAKQVMLQRVRESERNAIFEEFRKKIGDVLNGVVQRVEQRNYFIDIGEAEGILPPREQVNGEHYKSGDRIKVYVLDVKKSSRAAQIILSRTHPNLVRKLFEAEVPEIGEGVVTIQGISREAGSRSKVTVSSANKKVDPVGACVGLRGSRIQTIVRELHGEKIDVIPFSESVEQLLRSALQPAKISDIELKSEFKEARVIVKDDQLSLAIGKHGQNVRLASKLTGWKIDIVSEAKSQESLRKQLTEALFASAPSLEKLPGITGEMVQKLNAAGIGSVEALMQVNASELAMATGLELALIQEFIDKTAIYRVEAPAAVKEQTAAELFSKLDEAAGETKTVEKKVLASDLFANLDQAAAQAQMPAEAPAPQQQELISTEEPVKKRKRTSKKAALESEPAVKTDQDENEVSQA